jgi:hypothetical protein
MMNASAAEQRLEIYCAVHPGAPSAVRRPRIFFRSGVWIALLGESIKEGIAGFGSTVEAALRAFDVQYLNTLRPPEEKLADASSSPAQRSRSASLTTDSRAA